jgi:chaperonin GroEL
MTQTKEFIFEDAAREKLKSGIEILSNVASVTLGPKGRNVGVDAAWGTPQITSDGHSIVKEIEVKDQYMNMGVQMGQDVAAKMKQICGDGTTTSLILLNALTQAGVKLVASGASPILLKRGMDEAFLQMSHDIDRHSEKLEHSKDIEKMAIAASSGTASIGQLIAEAFEKVGQKGAITIEEAKGTSDILEIVNGMQIDRGYLSAHFCTNRENMLIELEKPRVLITDKKIHSIHELVPILQQLATLSAPLLIIADDIDSDALAALVINSLRGILKIAAIKAPGFGDQRKAILEDIAILSGATVVTEDTGMSLKDITVEQLGRIENVTISKDKTLFTQDNSYQNQIASRIKHIQHQIETASSSYEKEKLEERKSKLAGGVAVIYVGSPSEVELKKRKQLFQDALSSTKAALEQGIVLGAGMTLVRSALHLKNHLEGDEKLGFDMVLKACKAPALQLLKNAGFDPLLTLEKALETSKSAGLNVITEEIEDLKKSGIYEAAKVVKTALQLAISQAGIVILSEALIGQAPEELI